MAKLVSEAIKMEAITYVTFLTENVDERKEVRPLYAVLVEVCWGSVTGGDQNDSLVEQIGKQLLQNHCIRNIRNLQSNTRLHTSAVGF